MPENSGRKSYSYSGKRRRPDRVERSYHVERLDHVERQDHVERPDHVEGPVRVTTSKMNLVP